MNRPNIIFYICHDLGQQLGCYGHMISSPNLDRFADQGVRFENSFCNSPACSPSRGCIMTGKYAHSSGGIGLAHMGWPLPREQKTIVDYLNDNGYETAHVGLNHERHAGTNHYQIDEERTWEDHRAENAINKAVEYLESRKNAEKPFYLNIGSHEVHRTSYTRHAETIYGGSVPPDEVYIPGWMPDTPALRKEFGMFQAAIRYMDTHLGRLFGAIERMGYLDNSIVVVTTDHGISANRAKGTLYDRGVETALMMHLPEGMRNGYTVDHLIQNADLAPTLLEAAGVEAPSDMQGRSFWPLLTGGTYTPHEQIFIERNFHGEKLRGDTDYRDLLDPVRSVRTRNFHYIRRFDPTVKGREWLPWEMMPAGDPTISFEGLWPEKTEPRKGEELYHVRHDPLEMRDVAAQPEYRNVKAELGVKLQKWMEDTGDFVISGEVPRRYQEPGWGNNWPRTD